MFYVVTSLIALGALWAMSEWYTEKKVDLIVKRLERLEAKEKKQKKRKTEL